MKAAHADSRAGRACDAISKLLTEKESNPDVQGKNRDAAALPGMPGGLRGTGAGAADEGQSQPAVAGSVGGSPSAAAGWRAIVARLLATPSEPQPYEAPPERECALARRLGMHINAADRG